MLEKLHLLFRCGRAEQFADVLPGFQERLRVVAHALDRSLPLGDGFQVLFHLPLFLFQSFQFRLDAGKPPRPQALQNLDQAADVGMDLRQPAAGKVFGFSEAVGLAAQARQRFLNDPVAGFDHSADFRNPADDGGLQRFRRDAGGIARILAAFMVLAGADVVEILVRAAVGRCTDHVGTALAAKQAGEKVNPALGLLEIHASLEHVADLKLNPVELLLVDDRLVAILPYRIAPVNLPQVDRVAKNTDDLLLGEEVAAPQLVGARAVGRQTDAEVAQTSRDRAGRPQFLEAVEDSANNDRPFRVDLQFAGVILHRAVTEHMPAVPQPPVGTVTHNREGSFGGHLPLKLREHHDELNHRLAGRHRGVELLAKADDIHVMLGEERPEVNEVLQASGNTVELEADHEIDPASGDVPLEPLKLRAVLVLGAFARIDVELQ